MEPLAGEPSPGPTRVTAGFRVVQRPAYRYAILIGGADPARDGPRRRGP